MKYRKKPVVIEAIQFTNNGKELVEWCGCDFSKNPDGEYEFLLIHTLEGTHRADIGDYIIKGVKGEFYPCKPDIFEMTYEVEQK